MATKDSSLWPRLAFGCSLGLALLCFVASPASAVEDELTCGSGKVISRVINDNGKLKITCIELNCTRIRDEEEECLDFQPLCPPDNWVRAIATDGGKLVQKCCTYSKIAPDLTRWDVLTTSGNTSQYKTEYVKDKEKGIYYHEIVSNIEPIQDNNYNVTYGHLKCVPPPGTTNVGDLNLLNNRGGGGRLNIQTPQGQIGIGVGSCFADDSMVETPFGAKSMSSLSLADEVLVSVDGGIQRYDKIAYFLHKDPTATADFLQIATSSGKRITLTPAHLLSSVPCDYAVDQFAVASNAHWQFARDVEVGSCLLSLESFALDGKAVVEKVVGIGVVRKTGVYAPVTGRGNLFVDGVLASCFSVSRQTVMIRNLFEWIVEALEWVPAFALSYFVESFALSATTRSVEFPAIVQAMLEHINILIPESSIIS